MYHVHGNTIFCYCYYWGYNMFVVTGIYFIVTFLGESNTCSVDKRVSILILPLLKPKTSQWRQDERDCVSNHRRLACLLSCLLMRRSKKISKLCVTGLCEGNSRVTGEFLAQRASNADNVSIWWRHYEFRDNWVNTRHVCWCNGSLGRQATNDPPKVLNMCCKCVFLCHLGVSGKNTK